MSGPCRSPSLDEVWGDGASLEQSRDILFQQLHCVDAWVAMGSITLTILFFPPRHLLLGCEQGSVTQKLPIQPFGLNYMSSPVISIYLILVAVQTLLFTMELFVAHCRTSSCLR